MKQSFAIIGAGALGGLYGGMLAKAGFDVHFLLRSDFRHVRDNGLRVDTIWGDFHIRDVNVHATASTLPPCDVTIVALKTTQNHLLSDLLPAPTRDGGVVLVLQNGLNVETDSAAIVGPDRVLGGCCFLCSNKVGPGHIHHLDYGQIVFGEFAPTVNSSRANQICQNLQTAGISASVSDDLRMIRWRKLLWNIPFNGLSVVLDASTSELIGNPHSEALAEALIREVHSAADACGIMIPETLIEKTMSHTREMVPYDSSMRLDYLQHRPMEVESIFGNPLRAAVQAGADVPRLHTLYGMLSFLDQSNRSG